MLKRGTVFKHVVGVKGSQQEVGKPGGIDNHGEPFPPLDVMGGRWNPWALSLGEGCWIGALGLGRGIQTLSALSLPVRDLGE